VVFATATTDVLDDVVEVEVVEVEYVVEGVALVVVLDSTVLAAEELPAVPDGLIVSCMYPYNPSSLFPHRSAGKPGHAELHSLALLCSAGM